MLQEFIKYCNNYKDKFFSLFKELSSTHIHAIQTMQPEQEFIKKFIKDYNNCKNDENFIIKVSEREPEFAWGMDPDPDYDFKYKFCTEGYRFSEIMDKLTNHCHKVYYTEEISNDLYGTIIIFSFMDTVYNKEIFCRITLYDDMNPNRMNLFDLDCKIYLKVMYATTLNEVIEKDDNINVNN